MSILERSCNETEVLDETSLESWRLTRHELEIMGIVWMLGEATVRQVWNQLGRPLAYTTVMTTVRVLEYKKGVLERTKKGRAFVYRARISRESTSRAIMRDLCDLLFGGSVPALVSTILVPNQVSSSEVTALLDAIDELETDK
jgi:predicted transcriptional regulator